VTLRVRLSFMLALVLCYACCACPLWAASLAEVLVAAKKGDTSRLATLLDTSPSLLNAADPRNGTPLEAAISSGQIATVTLLLDRHADINARDNGNGETPLMHALGHPNWHIVELLIQRGANVTARTEEGYTVLHAVAESPFCRAATVRLLLDHGADPTAKMADGTTPLHILPVAGTSVNVADVAELLIAHHAQVMARNKVGDTPLHRAASGSSEELIAVLLAHGAEVNAKGENDSTPLHHAVFLPGIKVLLAHRARVNAVDKRGVTPLMEQAQYNDAQAIKTLITAGANVKLKDRNGKTAYDYAKLGNNARVYSLLRAGAHP
jgi:ankyrin repeat protein